MKLFFYCEGDADVREAEYCEPRLEVRLDGGPCVVDALVTLTDGSIQARMIDDGSDRARRDIDALTAECGHSVAVLTTRDLAQSKMRIRNWQSAISAFHRSRDAGLAALGEDVESMIRRRGKASLGEIIQSHRQWHPAVVIGATVLSLRARSLESDMDVQAWSVHTKLYRCQRDVGH